MPLIAPTESFSCDRLKSEGVTISKVRQSAQQPIQPALRWFRLLPPIAWGLDLGQQVAQALQPLQVGQQGRQTLHGAGWRWPALLAGAGDFLVTNVDFGVDSSSCPALVTGWCQVVPSATGNSAMPDECAHVLVMVGQLDQGAAHSDLESRRVGFEIQPLPSSIITPHGLHQPPADRLPCLDLVALPVASRAGSARRARNTSASPSPQQSAPCWNGWNGQRLFTRSAFFRPFPL